MGPCRVGPVGVGPVGVGPVGGGPCRVGKAFIALGHAAVRRRSSVAFQPAGGLLERLQASRPENSHEAEIRRP